MATETLVRDGETWTIETDGDVRVESIEIDQPLGNTEGGAPKMVVRQRITRTYYQGRLICSGRLDLEKPRPI